MMANWGLLRSEPRPRFSPVASLVKHRRVGGLAPPAAMVSTEPLGRLAVTSGPAQVVVPDGRPGPGQSVGHRLGGNPGRCRPPTASTKSKPASLCPSTVCWAKPSRGLGLIPPTASHSSPRAAEGAGHPAEQAALHGAAAAVETPAPYARHSRRTASPCP